MYLVGRSPTIAYWRRSGYAQLWCTSMIGTPQICHIGLLVPRPDGRISAPSRHIVYMLMEQLAIPIFNHLQMTVLVPSFSHMYLHPRGTLLQVPPGQAVILFQPQSSFCCTTSRGQTFKNQPLLDITPTTPPPPLLPLHLSCVGVDG